MTESVNEYEDWKKENIKTNVLEDIKANRAVARDF